MINSKYDRLDDSYEECLLSTREIDECAWKLADLERAGLSDDEKLKLLDHIYKDLHDLEQLVRIVARKGRVYRAAYHRLLKTE